MTDSYDLNDLAYFAWVVENQGFAPAGRTHGIAKSKLSRRIKALEDRLGVRLLQRSTRRFSVTAIGQEYYQHCKAVLLEAEAAQEAIDLRSSEPRGRVRLTCPVTLLHYAVGTMLADFMLQCPQVELHLEASNRRPDVIGEGIDVALRVRFPPLQDSELVMKKLGDSPQCLVASPGLLEGVESPRMPEDLKRLPSMATTTAHAAHEWNLTALGGDHVTVAHAPRLVTDDLQQLCQAAVAGVGVVLLPTLAIHAQLQAGTLVRLLPDWISPCGLVHAVFPSRRGMLPAVRALVDFLAERYARLETR